MSRTNDRIIGSLKSIGINLHLISRCHIEAVHCKTFIDQDINISSREDRNDTRGETLLFFKGIFLQNHHQSICDIEITSFLSGLSSALSWWHTC